MKSSFGRHDARKWVLESLYQFDLLNTDPLKVIESILKRERAPVPIAGFAKNLVNTISVNLEEIDKMIESTSSNWSLKRISYVDRAILRMAIGEMLGIPDVPYKVSISEAVEIAKEYSTEDSGSFVNGILDTVAKRLGHKEGEEE